MTLQEVANATSGGYLRALDGIKVGCFVIDPPFDSCKPPLAQDCQWVDTAWTLADTVSTVQQATVVFPTAKVILYTTFSMAQIQAEMEQQQVSGVAVSQFIVVKVIISLSLCMFNSPLFGLWD